MVDNAAFDHKIFKPALCIKTLLVRVEIPIKYEVKSKDIALDILSIFKVVKDKMSYDKCNIFNHN